MILTTAQLQTIKAAILADPALASQPDNSDGAFAIAAALNLPAAPDFRVWRSAVSTDEIMGNGFTWTLVDNLGVGRARIWEWMARLGAVNFSQANVRAGVLAAFAGGTGGFPEMRTAIFGHGARLASRVEKLLATGTGTASDAQGVGPGTMGAEGPISYQEVMQARAS